MVNWSLGDQAVWYVRDRYISLHNRYIILYYYAGHHCSRETRHTIVEIAIVNMDFWTVLSQLAVD